MQGVRRAIAGKPGREPMEACNKAGDGSAAQAAFVFLEAHIVAQAPRKIWCCVCMFDDLGRQGSMQKWQEGTLVQLLSEQCCSAGHHISPGNKAHRLSELRHSRPLPSPCRHRVPKILMASETHARPQRHPRPLPVPKL
eukprot:1138547-Pelagomonas_calceolata.AAC.14